ncbi:MAG: FMN-binding protein [Planctomycetaceae bacterium]|nr:FMN-binding protein [Planctomycetaceae bacterium]
MSVPIPPPPASPPQPRRHSVLRGWILHTCRLAMVAMVLVLIRWQHQRAMARAALQSTWMATLDDVQAIAPEVADWGDLDAATGTRPLLAANGDQLGLALQTAPQSNAFIGFSGPSNLLLVFDPRQRLLGVSILDSRDTRDHVEQVRLDDRFFPQLVGQTWDQLAAGPTIDGVSGATLTSVAMWRGIVKRLGGKRPNPLFPDDPPAAWFREIFPTVTELVPVSESISLYELRSDTGEVLGRMLRTTPAADAIIGYQGPTETLVCFQAVADHLPVDWPIVRLLIVRSYDNTEYVNYLGEDASFPKLLNDRTLAEVAAIDLEQTPADGVSGATMTSQAVVQGVIAAAQAELRSPAPVTNHHPLTIAVVLAAIMQVTTALQHSRQARTRLMLVVIALVGYWNCDLLSQAMFVGWAQSGVPWTSALGLVVLTGVATTWPTVARQNLYCERLCPHGAVQQLAAHRFGKRWSLGPRGHAICSLIPPLLLLWCVLVAMLRLGFSLVDIEPFDAWAWQIAGWPTLVIAVVGLVAALKIPLAYCRYGCPTGALLQYIRRHGRSDLLGCADLVALTALLLALIGYLADLG